MLSSPATKEAFKKQVKAKVIDFWETKLRNETEFLPSLSYFHPQFMSLFKTHRLWTTAGPKPYEVSKARIQSLFLGSQYRCGQLTKHWSASNPMGLCSFSPCTKYNIVESPEHILLCCPAHDQIREHLLKLCHSVSNPASAAIVTSVISTYSTRKIMQLLLDPSAMPMVISSAQFHGEQVYSDLFYIGRTWCFSIHRNRMKKLNRWNFR